MFEVDSLGRARVLNPNQVKPHANPTGDYGWNKAAGTSSGRLVLWRKPLNGNRVGSWRDPT